MGTLFDNMWQLVSMAVLLLCSGFLSGSETAFFNISRRQVKVFKESTNRLQNLASKLLENPRRLLTSLLFANMAVNVMYFALSSVYSIRVGKSHGAVGAFGVAGLAFFALLLCGEMLPKSTAYLHSRRFCITAAPGCYVCLRVLGPLLNAFEFVIVTPALRLLTGAEGKTETVTPEQFKTLIESTRQRGYMTEDQRQVFAEVIELGYLKVRHVMRPRVDMVTCDASEAAEQIIKLMNDNDLTKMPVYAKDIDNIVGLVHQRDLILSPDTAAAKLVRKVDFVPEQKSVESLLEFFKETRTDMAVAVDEYGGISGTVSLEDIVEELLGPIDQRSVEDAIEQIGPLRYRLAAELAIHDWAHAFSIAADQGRLCTIGGLATAILGKIPKEGDTAYLKNLKLTVEKVERHRIKSLVLSLEANIEDQK